jgi:hypothetical protein
VLLCSVPPQGLIAAQFHLMFQKPHLFMDINNIMGVTTPIARHLREALFAGEVDEAMLQIWMSRMQPSRTGRCGTCRCSTCPTCTR